MSTTTVADVHVFGVRHLSPGGAYHLLQTLDRIRPTAVLIEGPADATSEIRHLVAKGTKPPVAILAFTDELPVRTAMWPLASYSPEYQAMQWAAKNGAEAEFIDLPSSIMIAMDEQYEHGDRGDNGLGNPDNLDADADADAVTADVEPTNPADPEQAEPSKLPTETEQHRSEEPDGGHDEGQDDNTKHPLDAMYERIAELSGEPDYDSYWERYYEHQLGADSYASSIELFSTELRQWSEEDERPFAKLAFAYHAVREAYMRRRIIETIEAGHDPARIVVVCGSYHASALQISEQLPPMSDNELKRLPQRSTRLTLMPYSYYRLSSLSGYGAGNHAPHYYELMWNMMQKAALHELPHYYLSGVARELREMGTYRSTAEVIEAVRMAQSLASLRGGAQPVLGDLQDAARTLLGQGELSVVAEPLARLNVGTSIGQLAEGVSQTPIQDDLNRLLKQLKLTRYKTAVAAELALDLRENRRASSEASAFLDLRRSFLLHRLRLLSIDFAKKAVTRQDQATWAEQWVLQWSPEVEIQVIESTLLGETVEVAAGYRFQQRLDECSTLEEASKLIAIAIQCGMIAQLEPARRVLQRLAVDNRDVLQIAAAAGELSRMIRYGDVRRVDTSPLVPLLEQLFFRGCLFLTDNCNCKDEVATSMMGAIHELNVISQEHDEEVDGALWLQELGELMRRDDLNARLSGFACAVLMERSAIDQQDITSEMARRLSPGVPAELGAGWFEGLSGRNRYMLLSRLSLWQQLSDYMDGLEDEHFMRALVFLRRAFSTFSAAEKSQVAELLGEVWGIHAEQAAELLTGELEEKEEQMLDDLNEFDFDDF